MKPSIPKGTRDFGPQEMLRRKYIFNTIEKVFQKYGFLPLETPAMEHLETLTGKYGEEGDRLIFKVLNSGDFLSNIDFDQLVEEIVNYFGGRIKGDEVEFDSESTLDIQLKIKEYVKAKYFTEKALRYDLTVPFARYVVQHQNELAFPFKRYQIQPVWRADRPQKGRYREFYQCDADVIGSTSLLSEVDLMNIFFDVFSKLELRTVVKLNSRKVLAGIAEVMGQPEKLVDLTIVLDKLEKIGVEKVVQEAKERGITDESIARINGLLSGALLPHSKRNWHIKIDRMREFLSSSDEGRIGLKEVEFIIRNSFNSKPSLVEVDFDYTLARGLDYYTGAIFEVKAAEGSLQSSICGGGRYDDLTGVFGLKGMSGVGISFGADRIYDVLLETNKFPAELGGSTQLLFANFGEAEAMHCLKLLRQVREAGIAAEIYPDATKLPKQFTYAEKKGIPYVAIVGESEMQQGVVTLKRMGANEKGKALPIEAVIAQLAR